MQVGRQVVKQICKYVGKQVIRYVKGYLKDLTQRETSLQMQGTINVKKTE